uniref:DHHA2 domain-containing protein n=1 Tax=Globisporangium ultimum (strain ATCC 200006 / CBS 805.95 / DAOM BR144) TaxID=431595 RepID=K3X7X1_GLOUD
MSAFQWRSGTDDAVAQSVMAFNSFLRQAKRSVDAVVSESTTLPAAQAVHVAIGNEAADADSIVSSLVYAYFKHHSKGGDAAHVYLPVLPIPRDELALRCDVSALFQKLGLDLSTLVFVDEFPWQHAAFRSGRTRLCLTLLDHNALNMKRIALPQGSESVAEIVEILDHHMDLGKHPAASVREIAFADGQALVASNCTLVAEKMLDALKRDQTLYALPATLLLAVIGLDSVNFNPSAKKVTPRDITVAEELEKAAFASKEALFEWLQAEKFNPVHWAAFSIWNCLQCDYKEFDVMASKQQQYGVSAILIDLDSFVKKAEHKAALMDTLDAYARQNQLAFLVVMTIFVDANGARHRQLLFYENTDGKGDQSCTRQCVAFLTQENSLQLEPMELPSGYADTRLVAFCQRNVGASRKQVVPLIQRALTSQVKL